MPIEAQLVSVEEEQALIDEYLKDKPSDAIDRLIGRACVTLRRNKREWQAVALMNSLRFVVTKEAQLDILSEANRAVSASMYR